MLYCSNCHHLILNNAVKDCEICYSDELSYFDTNSVLCPENNLFPKDNEKGFIPNLNISFDANRKILDIHFNYLKNKHILSRSIDVYVNSFCIGRINLLISANLNTSVQFQCLNPKMIDVSAILPDIDGTSFWKIDLKP